MHTDETKGDGGVQQPKRHEQRPISPPTSTLSSPSHDFSFAISIHPSSAASSKNSTAPTFSTVDLSPADEIFFNGHLLPLHFLSHRTTTTESFTNPLDSFALPAIESFSSENNDDGRTVPAGERKSKSTEGQKRKSKFDHVSRFVAKYVRLMRPLVTALRNRRENRRRIDCNYFSSGNLKLRSLFKGLRGRNEFSAPALSTENNDNGTSDSTMEELQAAIQSAIAHCKNSIEGGR